MFAYTTPGVYFEKVDRRDHKIDLLRTDIAGFVGIAARGPLHQPVQVESWVQFTSTFGGHTAQGYLAYAVEGFFANGGQTCWVVRVADPTEARSATLELLDGQGNATLRLTATSPGTWAHQITVAVVRIADDLFQLTLQLTDSDLEIWRNLSMNPYGQLTLLDMQERATLRIGVWDPYTPKQKYHITLSQDEDASFFSLRATTPDGDMKCWSHLSMDPSHARYVETIVNNDENDWLVAHDLHSASAPPLNVPDPNAQNLRSGVGHIEPNPRYVETMLNDTETGSNLVSASDLRLASNLVANTPESGVQNLRDRIGRLACGADGLPSLRPSHLSGEGAPPDTPWGLQTLEPIDEVSMVAMPDILPKPVVEVTYRTPPPRCDVVDAEPIPEPPPDTQPEFPPAFNETQILQLQNQLVAHCEKLKDRIAILDVPAVLESLGRRTTPRDAITWRNQFDSTYAALYYPWLLVPDPLRLEGLLRPLPPSGHTAGVYARVSNQVGVHKPPANEQLTAVKDVQIRVEEIDHGDLNQNGVNVIRAYSGLGVRIAGARTVFGDNEGRRYVNVRRLLMMIEESIDERLQWTVFEPNNPALWRDVERVVRNFLTDLWRRAMLDGATEEEAFQVRCNAETNPPQETEQGRMICTIQVQPPWPAEFVVVRLGITEGGTEIIEA